MMGKAHDQVWWVNTFSARLICIDKFKIQGTPQERDDLVNSADAGPPLALSCGRVHPAVRVPRQLVTELRGPA